MVTFNPEYDKNCIKHYKEQTMHKISIFCEAAQSGDLDKIKDYINEFKDKLVCDLGIIKIPDQIKGLTPMHYAAKSGQVEAAKLLIEGGYVVDVGDPIHRTPLYFAAREGKIDMVKFLIEKGAHVNALSTSEGVPLHAAAKECHVEVAKLLVEYYADINAKDQNGYTPLRWANEKGCKEVVELLTHGVKSNNSTRLHDEVKECHVEAVKLLIENGANVNAKDSNGYTPLHWAASKGHQGILELLVKHKADVNVKDSSGYTPLHWAKDVEMVKLLIGKGADINAKDNYGYTTLHLAAKLGYQEIVDLLIKYGADIVKTNDGKLPSELAKNELVYLTVKTYEQDKEIERIKKQTDAEKAAEAQAQIEKEEAEKAKKAALEKDLKETEEKLKEVTEEKTTALDKLLKLQKDMRELQKEQPVIEKVLSDVKEEFNKCNLAQKLDTITNKLQEIDSELTPSYYAYPLASSEGDQSRFTNIINNILNNAELLNDSKMQSNIVTTVGEMLDMLKKCGSQSEEKLYSITDKIDEIKENIRPTIEAAYMVPSIIEQHGVILEHQSSPDYLAFQLN